MGRGGDQLPKCRVSLKNWKMDGDPRKKLYLWVLYRRLIPMDLNN